jgi:hypothetical protein
MRRLALLVALLLLALSSATTASAHNAAHVILPDGTCLNVGSDKEAPLVPEQNPNRLDSTGQLDLVPGSGDQYGARFAANESPTLLPGDCPA